MGLAGRGCVVLAAAVLAVSGCGDQEAPGQDSASGRGHTQSDAPHDLGETSVLEMSFGDAINRLNVASEVGDWRFLRDQWLLIEPGANLDASTASRNRLALSVRLAELVQVHVPEREGEARRYLMELSVSRFPFQREAAARAMRESTGREAVEALFARAVDGDAVVSAAALDSLRWKYESATMSAADAESVADAQLIERNIGRLCVDTRLPNANLERCREVTQARP